MSAHEAISQLRAKVEELNDKEKENELLANRIRFIQAQVEAKKKQIAKAQRALSQRKQFKQRREEEEVWLEQQKFSFTEDRARRVEQRKNVTRLRQEGLRKYRQEVARYKRHEAQKYRREKVGLFDAVRRQKELSIIANKQRSQIIRSEKEKCVGRRERQRLQRLREATEQKRAFVESELERKQGVLQTRDELQRMEREMMEQLAAISEFSASTQAELDELRRGQSMQGRKITKVGQLGQTARG